MNHGAVQSPDSWPSIWRWLSVSKRNAFELFPSDAYLKFRVSNRLVHTRLSVISRPETINEVCALNSKSFRLTNLQQRILSPSLGKGLILAEGDNWKRQRRLAAKVSAQSRRRQSNESAFVANRTEGTLRKWIKLGQSGATIDLHSDLLMLAMDALSDSLFGKVPIAADLNLLETVAVHRETIEAFDLLDAMGAPLWMQSFKMRKAKRIAARYDQLIQKQLDNDAVHQLDLPQASKRDFIVSMMTGFESIANTCLWALYEFTKLNTEIQDLLVDAACTDLVSMDLTSPVTNPLIGWVLETLRLYPPLPLIYRKATRDTETTDGLVRKGEVLCLAPWIVHRHRRLWNRSDQFDINRWMRVVPKSKRGFMPFGVGARQCIGQHIGGQISVQILQRCLRRIKVRTTQSMIATPRAGVTLRPMHRIAFSVEERSKEQVRFVHCVQPNVDIVYG